MLEQIQTLDEPEYHSIAEAADLISERLGRRVRSGAIRCMIESGKAADVPRAGGKRVFRSEDVHRIAQVMEDRAE